MTRYEYNPCVYVRSLRDDTKLYLLLYVDDMLITSRSMITVNELKAALSS